MRHRYDWANDPVLRENAFNRLRAQAEKAAAEFDGRWEAVCSPSAQAVVALLDENTALLADLRDYQRKDVTTLHDCFVERDSLRAENTALRARVAELEAKLEDAHEVLREAASYVGSGGYNAPEVDADVFRAKIMDGIDANVAAAMRIASSKEGG